MPHDESQPGGGPCRRGRPREFDVDAALDAALAIFWRHGYEGTSLSDLTDAMGISRPSLYAAFGNKEQLFRAAMDRYERRVGPTMSAALAVPTARAGVEQLLRRTADALTGGGEASTGCFLILSAMTCSAASAAVRDEAAARRRDATAGPLRARFDRAAADGELPAGTDTAALAGFYSAVLQGMSVAAASGVTRPELQAVADVALRAWPGERRG